MTSVVDLPLRDWQKKSLGDVCDILAGFGFPERLQGRTEGDLPFFKVGDISEAWKRGEVFLTKANHYITHSDAREIRARPLPPNTTVFAKIGAAIALNRRAILSEPSLVDNNVMGLHPASKELDHKFLFHFVCTQKLDEWSRATTVPSIRKSDIEQIPIPVPPLDEQHQIVAEIEKQFTRLEAGVAGLRRVQANLKRYRAAVLKTACEGKLVPTEAELARERDKVAAASRRWSSEPNQSRDGSATQEGQSYETGTQLLERILIQRHQWFDRQQLDSKTKKKYIEPARPETTNLPELSQGWSYASVEQLGIVGEQAVLTGPFGTNLGREDFTETGVPMLTISCLKDTGIHLEKADFVSEEKAFELDRYRLTPGDLLFSRMASVGRAGIIGEALRGALFNYHIMRLRLEPTVLLAKFYLAYVRGSAQVERYLREVNHGATRAGINTEQLLNMPVALPPLAEQTRIVAEVERRLSVVEELETVVSANLQRATRLRQSILQKAFTGQLLLLNGGA